jgi:glycosyltransferase involved in cell wall biosynthesis
MITNKAKPQKVTVIIPAFNEEARIGAVLLPAAATSLVSEIIVVSDGSTDRTAEVAASYNVRTEKLLKNVGKGGAMLHGAKCAEGADVLVFLDADLIGLRPEHIEALLQPVLSGDSAMAIGQFVGGRGVTDLAQLLVKCISGQRSIRRDLFLSIPSVDTVGYGVEMLITLYVSGQKLDTKVVTLRGVTHPMKEEKLGFIRGLTARLRMYLQMGQFWACYHFRGVPPHTISAPVLVETSDESNVIVGNGSGQDQAVDSVQNAPMAR